MDSPQKIQTADELSRLLESAEEARQNSDLKQAAEGFGKALELDSECISAWLGLARTQRDQNDLESAEQSFRKTISLDQVFFQAYLGLAGVLAQKNLEQEAFELLANASTKAKQLKEKGITQSNVLFFLGEIELELNNLAEAVGFFEDACETEPDNASLQEESGLMLDNAGYDLEALLFYKKALELDPELAHVYNRMGIAYRKQGQQDMALNLFIRALSFHPEDEHLIFNIARIYWEQGKFEESKAEISQALKINPDFKEAQDLLKMLENKAALQTGSAMESDQGDIAQPAAEVTQEAPDSEAAAGQEPEKPPA